MRGRSPHDTEPCCRTGARVDAQRAPPTRCPRPAGLSETPSASSCRPAPEREDRRTAALWNDAVVASTSSHAPRVTPPSLVAVEDGDPGLIATGDDVDGLRIVGADLTGVRLDAVTFQESELLDATMSETELVGCRFLDVRFVRLDALGLTAPRSTWRDTEIVSSRIGAASVYDAEIRSLRLTGCKIGYLNLRASSVSDLAVEDCTIDELDLADCELARASFAGCRVGDLAVRGARLQHVDLRGAQLDSVSPVADLRGCTIDHVQLAELAPALAAGLGIDVR